MRTLIFTPFLLFAVLLTGCYTAEKLNSIHIGMTKDQVTSLLGQPDSTSAQANIEYLTYYLTTDNGRMYGGDQPYSVRLVDGKVESFGRFMQLFDIYNRPPTGSIVNAPTWAQNNNADLASQLLKLKALKDQGALTDEEFQQAKAKLLSNLR
jgi:Short C-terminal domain/SmpA / OmlA family